MSSIMCSPKLRELSRTQLHALTKKSPKDTPSCSPLPKIFKDHPDAKGKGKAVAVTASPSPSSSTETLQLLYPEEEICFSHPQLDREARPDIPSTVPVPFSEEPPIPPADHSSQFEHAHGAIPPLEAPDAPGWRAEEEEEEAECDYVKGAPSHYMVVDTLRQFTILVNTIPIMETRIAESRCLLRRTETLLKKVTPEARELTVTREYLETFLLAKMKKKQELWDGTGKMEKRARKFRMEWLRAERNAENRKRWREANELNKKFGLEEEPFSAFASESDEEGMESLQTTPTSSGSESSKRARGESTDEGSDAESVFGESRKKRARW